MKRLIALIVLLVFGSVAYADYEMSDSEKERYLKWGRQITWGGDFALAVAPNGCYDVASGGDASGGMYQAKREALARCEKKCKSSTCRIMDVNGTSAFIKQRGSSSSSSTASTVETLQIWGGTYIGEVVNGQPHGQGTLTWPSGNNYVGGWKGGNEWEGIRYWASGGIYGTYSNGKWCYGCTPTPRQLAIVRQINSSQIATAPTPAQKPTLTIRSSPTDAKVYIGGAYKGTTELKVKLPLGNYSLRVEKSGYNNFNQQIELKKDMVLWASLSKKEKQKPEPKPEPKPQAPKLIGTGTGFIVNKDYVVTAEHVLEDCNVVRVRFGHKEIAAKTVTMDASSDLGLLRLGKSIASAEVSWVVRIGLFKRSANADKYEARLRQHGLDPQRESIMVDGQLATRLFLGPFPTIDKADKEQQSAEIAAKDLALKVTERSATAKLRGGKPIRVGATVATYGYPLFGKLSDSAKITQGHINSLAGIDNDSSRFQYDAPTQFGNSGGPVLDAAGNVVGVVVSGLDDAKTQSINFAVKSNIVENFLSSNNVPYEKSDSREKLELPDIAEKAERFTVLVGCWQ